MSVGDTLYTKEVRDFIRTRPWPTNLAWMVSEYEEYLQFILFRDNFNSFDGDDQYQIAMKVKEVMEKIRGSGIPIYLEVRAGNGREQ